ncbi:MAG TPA: YhbY family RNA-binding protein [Spirochaetota bacterium]|nr:YhbY family RNA-binding protein [Spirochaetota bacterium]HPI90154.1 YhbY family RNA-binding protein [Spirochaetota bacterium]HPR48913.1 YhbY family RNA-binding protein [Spirochaetota bacterium]
MQPLTREQLKLLKSRAHGLKPVIQIGHKGLTDAVIAATIKALEDHELIKVKFLDFKDEKMELAARLAAETDSSLVTIIGNIAVIYKMNEEMNGNAGE